MKEFGTVIEIQENRALVNVQRQSACGQCKACELGSSDKKEINILCENSVGAEVGDNVNLHLETPDILKAAAIVYMIPLAAVLIGITLTYYITGYFGMKNDALSIGVGLLFMAASYLIVRKKDKKLKNTNKYEPIITEILGKNII